MSDETMQEPSQKEIEAGMRGHAIYEHRGPLEAMRRALRAAGAVRNAQGEGASCSEGQKAEASPEINPLIALADKIDAADHMVLRVVGQDNVGNSELKDEYIPGEDHNRVVNALRAAAISGANA